MRAVLVGNYGVGNMGDEALREYFLQHFADVDWWVTSARPARHHEIARLPMGLRSFVSSRWFTTVRALWQCDAVVFGGGSLFTDVESLRACFIWGFHALVARLFRKPVYVAFQGIGPFRTKLGERITRYVLRSAAFISVRDHASFARAHSLCPNQKITQTFDPVILLLASENLIKRSQEVLTIIPRKNSPNSFSLAARAAAETFQSSAIHVVCLQPADPGELHAARQVVRTLGRGEIIPIHALGELAGEVRRSTFVLSARYHGALAALAMGVPFRAVAQSEGDKLAEIGRLGASEGAALRAEALFGEEVLRRALHLC